MYFLLMPPTCQELCQVLRMVRTVSLLKNKTPQSNRIMHRAQHSNKQAFNNQNSTYTPHMGSISCLLAIYRLGQHLSLTLQELHASVIDFSEYQKYQYVYSLPSKYKQFLWVTILFIYLTRAEKHSQNGQTLILPMLLSIPNMLNKCLPNGLLNVTDYFPRSASSNNRNHGRTNTWSRWFNSRVGFVLNQPCYFPSILEVTSQMGEVQTDHRTMDQRSLELASLVWASSYLKEVGRPQWSKHELEFTQTFS